MKLITYNGIPIKCSILYETKGAYEVELHQRLKIHRNVALLPGAKFVIKKDGVEEIKPISHE
jgi:hypothetical protein